MDDFEIELKMGFLDEAAAALADVEQCFLTLETQPDDPAVIDKIFRLAHNLKGSSRAVGFDEMGLFTHQFESLLLKIKNKEIVPTPNLINLLLRSTDHLVKWVDLLKGDLSANLDSSFLLEELKNPKADDQNAVCEELSSQSSASSDEELQISVDEIESLEAALDVPEVELESLPVKMDACEYESPIPSDETHNSNELNSFEEEIAQLEKVELKKVQLETAQLNEGTAPPQNPQIPSENRAVQSSVSNQSSSGSQTVDESIRVSTKKLERLLNYVGELTILQSVLNELAFSNSSSETRKTVHQLSKVSKEIQDISMGLRMVPIRPTFQKMQRIVRDTAQSLSKEVQLVLVGEETELDKTVLEKINDPLVHLVRNSVDHGIEIPEDRVFKGKSPQGKVTLSAFHRSGRLIIEVKDDGHGIDPEKLRKKAVQKGIIKENASLSEKQTLELIFAPSFSTKEVVTDISGRGVGMDVVKTNIEALQGEVSVSSKVGEGSIFTISLPLTLAIIEGMIVRCGQEKFVIPISHIHESLRPDQKDIQKTSTVGQVLLLRGENLPAFKMAELFGRKSELELHQMISLVIRSNGFAFSLFVDDIIGKSQVVIKQLGPELSHLKGVSGSTILGDGKPALIVEPQDLIKSKLNLNSFESRRVS